MKHVFFTLFVSCMLSWMSFIQPLHAQEFAYVGNTLSGTVSVVDVSAGTLATTINVGAVPVDIAISPDTTQLAVVCALGDTVIIPNFPTPDTIVGGAIYLVDPVTNTVTSTFSVSDSSGSIPSDANFNTAGTAIYVSYLSENRLELFDLSGNSLADIPFPGGPTDFAPRPGTDSLYILKGSQGEMGVLESISNTPSSTSIVLEGILGGASSNPFAMAITPDGTKAFVANSSAFYTNVVDLTTYTTTRVQSFGFDAFMNGGIAVAITPDGTKALVTQEGGHILSIIDVATNSITNNVNFTFGDQPIGVAPSLDNNQAIVALNSLDEVAIVDLTALTFTKVGVGDAPRDVVLIDVDPCRAFPLTQIADTVCDDVLPITFGTQSLTAAGVYTETFTSAIGCDSMVELSLVVNPTYSMNLTAAICDGDSYIFGSQTLTTAGTYTESLQSVSGCDSILTLTLTVNPNFAVTDSAFICQGQSLTFGTQTLNTSGVYTETFQSQDGCDSVVTLTLNVGNLVLVTLNEAICDGESFPFGGQNLTVAGQYSDTLVASTGCDSVVNLTLEVNPTYNEQVADTVCDSDLPLTFGSQSLTAAGVYTEVFASTTNCDSTVELTLTVNPTYNESIADTLCDDELPIMFGTQMISAAGVYTETFSSLNTCDSTVELTLTVHPTYNVQMADTVCEGELPYTFGSQSLMMAGVFTENFQTIQACDSSVELTLTVNPEFTISVTDTISEGDLPYTFGVQVLDSAGTFTEPFMTSAGCDSIVTLTLEVLTSVLPSAFQEVKLYPNPASEQLHVEASLPNGGTLEIVVMNAWGQEVQRRNVLTQAGQNSWVMDMENLSNGIYYLKLKLEGEEVSRRFTILK